MVFGKATIKGEGMIADPDEFEWGCNCEKCVAKYNDWKRQFNAQQDAMNLASDPTKFKPREERQHGNNT